MLELTRARRCAGWTAAAATAALLAGCATTSAELRDRGLDTAGFSEKPAPAVVACVIDSWERNNPVIGGFPVSVRPLANGGQTVHAATGTGTPMYFVDVRPTPSGSSSAFYINRWSLLGSRARDSVQACQ